MAQNGQTRIAALAVLSLALSAFAPQEQKVRIFIGTYERPGQYLEPGFQDRADSAKDIEGALKKTLGGKKVLEFVKDRASAEVEIEVAGRTTTDSAGQVTVAVPTGFGGFIAGSSPEKRRYVFAWLRAGEFRRELSGTGGLWRDAGTDLADQVLDWVKANQKALLSSRKQVNGSQGHRRGCDSQPCR